MATPTVRGIPKNQTKWESFRDFVWDSENKTIIGRNAKSWVQITIFYIILYVSLAGFFIGCMTLFFKTTNDVFPNRIGYASPMKYHPGMGFRPILADLKDFIEVEQGVEEQYSPYVKSLDKFFERYENQTENIQCANLTPDEIAEDVKPCFYKPSAVPLGCDQSPYGFSEGTPCFALTLNKVYQFVPELDANSTGIEVVCEGIKEVDRNAIVLEVKPKFFDRKFFPYLNRQGYVSPYVMVKVVSIENEKIVNIWCRAIANNLVVHRNDRAAGVTFSVKVY